jgi:hypothetical protein
MVAKKSTKIRNILRLLRFYILQNEKDIVVIWGCKNDIFKNFLGRKKKSTGLFWKSFCIAKPIFSSLLKNHDQISNILSK